MNIFASEAQKYWAKNLPAIPLMKEHKRPAIHRWQTYADIMPTEEERAAWLSNFPDGNIGLPMGPASGLVAIDIDTEDQNVIRVLESVLPPSPWVRVGRKGSVRVYRFSGQRTTRIKGADGGMICEILSKGTQFVLPPSIHPDTKMPYTANCDLVDVLAIVPELPLHFEDILRGALKDIGIDVAVGGTTKISHFVPAGARDSAMTAHAGILARSVTRGERSLLEALGEMAHWVESFVEKVIGDELSPHKAQQKLVEFLVRDVTSNRGIALPPGWDEGLSDEDKASLGLNFTESNEIWAKDRILEHLASEFNRFAQPDSAGWAQAVDVALDQIARSNGTLSLIDEERILRFIVDQSANSMSLGTLKKQVTLLRKGTILGENHQEIAVEVEKYLTQFGEIRYEAEKFWQWRGSHFEPMDNQEIIGVISREFGFYPSCRRFSDYQGVFKTLAALVKVKNGPLKRLNTNGLNFANGFLTESLQLIGHNPDYGMTYTLPYRYMEELAGHMPMFNQYLMDSWGDDPDYQDKVDALQEALGASLFGVAPRYQRAICLIGQPGSGKSRILGILRGLLPPESASNVSPHDWADKYLPAEMHGKLINFAGELSGTKPIPDTAFKEIVEGAKITAQRKNQQPFDFYVSCAQWFASNFIPKTKDTSDGFNRRWLFLQWEKRVSAEKKIADLDQIILEHEREAIVAWAVRGFERLVKNNDYTLPTSHMGIVDQMASGNNSVRYFLAECPRIIVGRDKTGGLSSNEITETTLHGEYWSFCVATGTAQRASLKAFHNLMEELQAVFHFQKFSRVSSQGHLENMYRFITLAKT